MRKEYERTSHHILLSYAKLVLCRWTVGRLRTFYLLLTWYGTCSSLLVMSALLSGFLQDNSSSFSASWILLLYPIHDFRSFSPWAKVQYVPYLHTRPDFHLSGLCAKMVNILKSNYGRTLPLIINWSQVKTAKYPLKTGRYHLHSWYFPSHTPVGGGLGLFDLVSRMINDPRTRSWGLGMSWKSFSWSEPTGLAIRPNGARPAEQISLSSCLIIIYVFFPSLHNYNYVAVPVSDF